MAARTVCHVGARVKSGWAAVVILAREGGATRILHSGRVELANPDDEETRQPYHARANTLELDQRKIDRRIAAVRRAATAAVGDLVRRCDGMGARLGQATLVAGSLTDPATIASAHMRAHALEGRLFWSVLQEALEARSIDCLVVAEKQAIARAAARMARAPADVLREVATLGRGAGAPWRAEQKVAAAMALASFAKSHAAIAPSHSRADDA
jgi:hypothetical protein